MKLPSGIEKEILEYLHLEYGESEDDPDALKLSDLKYEGEHLVDKVVTHFWSYPSGPGRRWVTVEMRGKGYDIGTSPRGPGGVTIDRREALRTLRIEFRWLAEGLKPMRPVRVPLKGRKGSYSAEVPLAFPSGDKLQISVEAYDFEEMGEDKADKLDVTLIIEHEDDRRIHVRCASGLAISYETLFGYECLISVGTGPWDE
jgi:hypothetical protein